MRAVSTSAASGALTAGDTISGADASDAVACDATVWGTEGLQAAINPVLAISRTAVTLRNIVQNS
jgi:hypothetical protein